MGISDFGFWISDFNGGRLNCELRRDRDALTTIRGSAELAEVNPQSAIRNRSGISLLEVLISMFVLLFGLMGVAMIFPVGNHYAGRSDQYDRGAVLADQALAELKARGMLNTRAWMYSNTPTEIGASADANNDTSYYVVQRVGDVAPDTFNYPIQPGAGPGHAFIIDPMGVAAGYHATPPVQGLDVFPYQQPSAAKVVRNPWTARSGGLTPLSGTRWPIRRITVPASDPLLPNMTPQVAETLCRLRDDLVNAEPEQDDRPGIQQLSVNSQGTESPVDDVPLQRQYSGNYSWLATVVPTEQAAPIAGSDLTGANALQPMHSQYATQRYEVSVAVFNRRNVLPSATSERMIAAEMFANGEIVIHGPSAAVVDAALQDVRPGQFIALAGVRYNGQIVLKWYKLLSVDPETTLVTLPSTGNDVPGRMATLQGGDWPAEPSTGSKPYGYPIEDLRAIILPGVIAVATEKMTMEGN